MKLIAEISCNHAGSKRNALKLIKEVAPYATHVKLQLWEPDTMAIPGVEAPPPWDGVWLMDLYRQAETPREWLPDLFSATIDAGAVPMVSVFDLPSLAFLESIGCPEYKIASFEAVDTQLLWEVGCTGKPMTISTGQVSMGELQEIVGRLPVDIDLTLLHCVSEYPTRYGWVNMNRMVWMKQTFDDCRVGFSDHTQGTDAAMIAAALGADAIEKHVKLDGHDTLDAEFSITPDRFRAMAFDIQCAQSMLGDGSDPTEFDLRRSLYFARPMEVGETVSEADLITRRPNAGLCPLDIKKALGRKLTQRVERYQPVDLRLLDS